MYIEIHGLKIRDIENFPLTPEEVDEASARFCGPPIAFLAGPTRPTTRPTTPSGA